MAKVMIAGIPVEVLTNEAIWESGTPIIAVPVSQMMDIQNYAHGTKKGYPCNLCNEDCILAPSGQTIIAAGKNAVLCLKCLTSIVKQQKQGEN